MSFLDFQGVFSTVQRTVPSTISANPRTSMIIRNVSLGTFSLRPSDTRAIPPASTGAGFLISSNPISIRASSFPGSCQGYGWPADRNQIEPQGHLHDSESYQSNLDNTGVERPSLTDP